MFTSENKLQSLYTIRLAIITDDDIHVGPCETMLDPVGPCDTIWDQTLQEQFGKLQTQIQIQMETPRISTNEDPARTFSSALIANNLIMENQENGWN